MTHLPTPSSQLPAPNLPDFVTPDVIHTLIRLARHEDLGEPMLDVTAHCMFDAHATGSARFVARAPGVLSGAALLRDIADAYDPQLKLDLHLQDGSPLQPGTVIATLTGNLRELVTVERVALNFMTLLSGVATLTARYVAEVAGTACKVCDTRKTLPGFRGLQKYAVACGGGTTHRMGLYDALLVKDNHIAGLTGDALTDHVRQAIHKARDLQPDLKFAMVEVDTLDQLRDVLKAQPDLVLLDNMPPDVLRQAVTLRNDLAPAVQLEASGGITLDALKPIAHTGIDRVSIGALTHSAPALDIGLDK